MLCHLNFIANVRRRHVYHVLYTTLNYEFYKWESSLGVYFTNDLLVGNTNSMANRPDALPVMKPGSLGKSMLKKS